MTHPMTDERLAELRGGFVRGRISLASAPPSLTEEVVVTIGDVRALLAREAVVMRTLQYILSDISSWRALPRPAQTATEAMALLCEHEQNERRMEDLRTRLDAAEELIREVADKAVEISNGEPMPYIAELDLDVLAKCCSYLR